jgi:archaeal flagellin FlaB
MMNTLMRCIRKKRGIVGIEAAIVLIAFVVIAAALAYVVINMGFYSAQTAKSTISKGINEATSALELDGYITAWTNSNGSTCNVTALAIPLKLAVAQQQVDMAGNTVVVAVEGANFSLANVYNGSTTSTATDIMTLISTTNSNNWSGATPNATAFLYNALVANETVLQQNGKAFMIVWLGPTYALNSYSSVTVEIRTSVGAALMIQRDIPGGLPTNSTISLG